MFDKKKWYEEHKEHNKEYFKKYNKERHQKLKNNPEAKRKRKETRKEADIKYRHNPKHKREKRKWDKKYWQKNRRDSEYKRKKKEYNKKRREKYKDKLDEQCKRYRDNNKDKRRETRKNYAKKHPEVIRKHCRKRRAMKNNIIETFSDKEWLQALKNTFGVCPRCNKYVGISKLSLDHTHPISKAVQGQIYTIDDVQPLCNSCNSKKNNKIENNMEVK